MTENKYIENTSALIVISGSVQGVGYRYFIARAARELGIKGYAENLFNGNVEIMAEGRREFIEELIKRAKTGNGYSRVSSAKVEWLDFNNKYDNFEIR